MKTSVAGRPITGLILFVACCAGAGCSRSPSPALTPPAGAALGDFGGEPVTAGEYYDAARTIEQAATESAEVLGKHFDMMTLLTNSVRDLQAEPQFEESTRRAFVRLVEQNLIGTQIYQDVPQGGSYRLLRVTRRGDQHFAAFRLINLQGVNYHNLKLTKNAAGKIVVDDAYIFLSGELMSTSMRRMFLPAYAEQNRSNLQKLLKPESEFIASGGKLKQMSDAFRDRDYAAVSVAYHSLPKSVREQKSVLIRQLTAAAQLQKHDEYAAGIAEYKRLYPADRSIDLFMIDTLIREHRVKEALAATDRVDQAVGGDHHLDIMRSAIHVEAGNLDEAERLCMQAMQHPDALPDSYWHFLNLLLKKKDFERVKTTLLDVEQRFQTEFDDLEQLPDYAEFVKSPQYQEWLKRERPAN